MARNGKRATIADIAFIGEVTFPTGFEFDDLVVGGLSGIVYDASRDHYLAISDDRSQFDPARFFTLEIDLADGTLDAGDVVFTNVTGLSRQDGSDFPPLSLDPEGIALDRRGRIVITSEGDANPARLFAPAILRFDGGGMIDSSLPVDFKFLPTSPATSGIRNNLAFESLTISPNGRWLYTATENALVQDGPAATADSGSLSRIVKYDARSGQPVAEYAYITDPVAVPPTPAGAFATNGLVELLALDDNGTLLAMERSFSVGAPGTGNTIKIYLVQTQGATDISGTFAVRTEIDDGELAAFLDAPVKKELLFDLAELGIPLDNVEGMALGPQLPDGRQSLVLVSDNNFLSAQFTQVLAFALEVETTPLVRAKLETPDALRYDNPFDTTEGPDSDDPAVWVNPADEAESIVVTALKEGGLRVHDLTGQEIQRITPEVRYNNVDILYNVALGDGMADLAIASDREHDTIAIYRVDAATRQLTNITADGIADDAFSIFGVDDGEATAYGLAAYTSPVDGAQYVFVTQADGAQIAQLRITDAGGGKAGAEIVRILDLPVPDGEDPADYQSEGITIDRETGIGYVTVEDELGLLAFSAEPTGPAGFTTVAPIDFEAFTPDLEGVAILYGKKGKGSILVSSQGDSSFAVFDRETWAYQGSFAVGDSRRTDGVEESDGLEIFSGSLGSAFPRGLMITHDGSNDPAAVFPEPGDEDAEVQNWNTNFKFVDLRKIAREVGIDLGDRDFDPREVPNPISGPLDVF